MKNILSEIELEYIGKFKSFNSNKCVKYISLFIILLLIITGIVFEITIKTGIGIMLIVCSVTFGYFGLLLYIIPNIYLKGIDKLKTKKKLSYFEKRYLSKRRYSKIETIFSYATAILFIFTSFYFTFKGYKIKEINPFLGSIAFLSIGVQIILSIKIHKRFINIVNKVINAETKQ